jgi:hypothetical protein
MTCTAWLLMHWSSAGSIGPFGLSGLLLVCASATWLVRKRLRPGTPRILLLGATLAVLVALAGLMMSVFAVVRTGFDFGDEPFWIQKTADALKMPAMGICVVVAAWWVTLQWRAPPAITAGVLASAATLALAAAPGMVRSWSVQFAPQPARERFAAWRRVIPKDAEVFWPDGLREVWFLLDRRSYLSLSQLGGVVFSEELANEARERALVLSPLAPAGKWFGDVSASGDEPVDLTREALRQVCASHGPDFIVGDEDLGWQVARIEWPDTGLYRYLYECRSIRARG